MHYKFMPVFSPWLMVGALAVFPLIWFTALICQALSAVTPLATSPQGINPMAVAAPQHPSDIPLVIAQLQLDTFPIEGSEVRLRYQFQDQDCEDAGQSAYCSQPAALLADIDLYLNQVDQNVSLLQGLGPATYQIKLEAPLAWDMAAAQPLPLKIGLRLFGEINDPTVASGDNQILYSNYIELETILLQDFTAGENIIQIGSLQYLRPALLSDTQKVELPAYRFRTHPTDPFEFALLNQQQAITHCQSHGWSLVNQQQLQKLLAAALLKGVNWPIGSAAYLTQDQLERDGVMYPLRLLVATGNSDSVWLSEEPAATGLVICVLATG